MPSQWSLPAACEAAVIPPPRFSCRSAPHRHGFFSTGLPPAPVAAGSPRKSGSPFILSLRSTPPRILLHLASSCSCCRGLAAQVGLALNPVASLHTATDFSPPGFLLLLLPRARRASRARPSSSSCRCAPHRHGFLSTWLPPAPVAAGSPIQAWLCDTAAVRSSLSQAKGLPSTARLSVFSKTAENNWR